MSGKVFGIGISKTGTLSLAQALVVLGYKTIHFPMTMEQIDINDASMDITVACRFEMLDTRYPGSKFIFTVREMTSWLKSCEDHYTKRILIELLSERTRSLIVRARRGMYGTEHYDPEIFKETYIRHRDKVFTYFKERPRDLLVMNICEGDGWTKLCPFLGHPVPDVPFPHRNKSGYNK
jgi:hypothetical protein